MYAKLEMEGDTMACKLTDVSCTYTGGGIYVCTAKLTDSVWFVTDFETYGTYDVPYDELEAKYSNDYDAHWTNPSCALPTWQDVLTAVKDSFRQGHSPNMDTFEVEKTLRYYHPDLSLRVNAEDDRPAGPDGSDTERLETIASFIEMFEGFLEERGIDVPNPEKADAVRDGSDPESISTIYGSDYGDLSDRIEALLTRYGVLN